YQDLVTGFFDREVHPNIGQVTMARADFPGRGTFFTQGLGPQAFAVAMASGEGSWGQETGQAWETAGRCWGPDLGERISQYAHALTLTLSLNDESDPDNRVKLADDWPP